MVHLYDDALPACRRMNRVLELFARSQPNLRILRMPAADAPGGARGLLLDVDSIVPRFGSDVVCVCSCLWGDC